MTKPADLPPPFRAADYVAAPSDPVDERIEVGILVVGAGPAGLACAIRLGQLLEGAPEIRVREGTGSSQLPIEQINLTLLAAQGLIFGRKLLLHLLQSAAESGDHLILREVSGTH